MTHLNFVYSKILKFAILPCLLSCITPLIGVDKFEAKGNKYDLLEELSQDTEAHYSSNHRHSNSRSSAAYISAFNSAPGSLVPGSLFSFPNEGESSHIKLENGTDFVIRQAGDYYLYFNISNVTFSGNTGDPTATVLVNGNQTPYLPAVLLSGDRPTDAVATAGIVRLPANSVITLQYSNSTEDINYSFLQTLVVIEKVN